MTAPFIVLEGPDGAGKTTLARSVASLLAHRGLRHLDRRQIADTSPFVTHLMEQLANMLWNSGDSRDLADDFWAHLQASWFSAHGQHVVRPALADGPVIVDGWYHKLAAKLSDQGWAEPDLDRLFARVRRPDHVILLRTSPKAMWERRVGTLRPTELGMHNREYTDLGEQSFLDHQQRTLDNLTTTAENEGWHVVDVPDHEDVNETATRLVALISGILDASAASAQPADSAGFTARYIWPNPTPSLKSAVLKQMSRSLSDRDGRGVIGEFERAFATFVGTEHAVAMSSGTAGLHAMCAAAGLSEGDEIIAPAYTFFATATPFAYEGVQVRFADADSYGNLDPASLPRLLTERTRAVIVTHMWGVPCDMTAISAFCRDNGLLLLEDCSHAHFASWDGHRVGTFSDMAVFSTNQKAITTGEGGVLVTDNPHFKELALLHGQYNKRCFQEISADRPHAAYALTGMGLKSRSTTLGAAIGLDQLAVAADIESRRRHILGRFDKALAGNPVVSLSRSAGDRGEHGLYVMGLRYDATAATCSMAEFVDRLTADGADFDIPGSTGVIAHEPLFHRTNRTQPWTEVPDVKVSDFPGADSFIRSFFKGPLWGYPGDEASVEHQLATLTRHAAAVVR
ncbi:aminotransferase class I/II-fold pyridoxal phosphate-dependent enzyme [Streptomyces europaeiscabiei]|uniref:aminotransferase class I/II-fold pyridoxal phosphate-dependent enzyme n=1 Tax=Streptomyces europaeiscabiei TaxID=146819 RepID=UPI002E18839B